ncbi:MAG: DUF1499 domain-containing protein [Alcanivoracaceae bacterium]|jgi:uncharacterized protein (DUF1499 family)|nr:DUF1499 domain-containing protein [Alcanivoracaceae bacterium]
MKRHNASHLALIAGLLGSTGVHAQMLPDCPQSPNCVSSQASDEARRVAPLAAGSSAAESRAMLTALLDSLPRVEWTAPADNIIQATFKTRILRFTDDVLFHIDDDGMIQVRSASRIGYSDLGANRSRVEMLREELAASRKR